MAFSELIGRGLNETKHNKQTNKKRQDLPHAITINTLHQQFKLIHKYKTYTTTNRQRRSFPSSDYTEEMNCGSLYFSLRRSVPFRRDRVRGRVSRHLQDWSQMLSYCTLCATLSTIEMSLSTPPHSFPGTEWCGSTEYAFSDYMPLHSQILILSHCLPQETSPLSPPPVFRELQQLLHESINYRIRRWHVTGTLKWPTGKLLRVPCPRTKAFHKSP